jgi:hypothetical protein
MTEDAILRRMISMQEIEINWAGEGHSAGSQRNGKWRNFVGEECYEINGQHFWYEFKLVCPNCDAEGADLRHKNWYMSKEADEDLFIECTKCGNAVNAQNEKDILCWRVAE